MPLVNGLEFQDILAHRGYRQPIIFLTAHADVDMAISAFRSGAADILKKPVSSEILLEAVERAVESDFAFRKISALCAIRSFTMLSHREKSKSSTASMPG